MIAEFLFPIPHSLISMQITANSFGNCPIPIHQYPHILMAHGGGGKLMQQLIEQMFIPVFGEPNQVPHDATTVTLPSNQIALTTDSYVVNPLIFPGGNIGSMAVYGTVNDLAMAGARPLYLTVGLILEEGLPMTTLWEVVQAMQAAAQLAQVKIITGDTKVVDQGKGDGIFINTAGVGVIETPHPISPQAVQPGDVVLINGDLGRHGIAIMAVREGLEFETTIESDSAPLAGIIGSLLAEGIHIHCLRDLTRGGLTSALNEIAQGAGVKIAVDAHTIPVREDVQGACEILGFDPLYIANEGRFVAFVPPAQAQKALEIIAEKQRISPCTGLHNTQPQIIGQVLSLDSQGQVILQSQMGSTRILDMLSGEQLPRIC